MAPQQEGPLGALGWQGLWRHDDPAVAALRGELEREAGLGEKLEIIDPAQPGFAEEAARLFHRDGFVCIRDCLRGPELEALRAGCDTVIRRMLEHDPARQGNRDSHRYSFARAAIEFGCVEAWACTVDCPPVLAALTAIWGGDASFTCSGVGGDFVLPGCVEYQALHADGGLEWAMEGGATIDARAMPPLLVCCCFPMVVEPRHPDGHTLTNGATRFIPGTVRSKEKIPSLEEEARSMRLSTAAPLPAGSALIRDVRCCAHPNLSLPSPG